MNQLLLFWIVVGRQSNYEGFYMFLGICYLGILFLYWVVVWWGLFLGWEFICDDVSEVFSIEFCCVSGIFNYICNCYNDDDICFDFCLYFVWGGCVQFVVCIWVVEFCLDIICWQWIDWLGGKVSDWQYDCQMVYWLLFCLVGGDMVKLVVWQVVCLVWEVLC